jgi:hypothetical protein
MFVMQLSNKGSCNLAIIKPSLNIPSWILERWIIVAYLYPAPIDITEQIRARPSERFYEVIGKHLRAYVDDGTMPPEAIAGPIMNLADDFMNGRDMTLKTGDYIALQNFMRKSEKQ